MSEIVLKIIWFVFFYMCFTFTKSLFLKKEEIEILNRSIMAKEN